jgi:Rieske 2Fe-2S family protein
MATFKRTNEHYAAGSLTLPQAYYTSEEVFARETDRIFRAGWTCAGHASRIPNPGEYFLLNVFNESLIVVRDRQGGIRAFYNVCRHRGTRICEEGEGRFSGSIQCSYHAWTYGLDGRLIGAPFMKDVPGFDWEEYPLKAAPVHLWEGFVFVHLGVGTPPAFEETHGALLGRFDAWKLERLRSHTRIMYEVQSNWKYIFQNFNECYHCPTIHPLLNKLTDYTSGHNDLIEGPYLGGYMDILNESLTVTGRMCSLPLGDLGEDARRGYYYSILPNLLLNVHPDYVMFHTVTPHSAGRSTVVSEWLFNPGAFEKPGFHPQDAVDFWHETNLQDWHVCELGQLGVSSQAYSPGWYTPRESLLAAFDRHYMKIMTE